MPVHLYRIELRSAFGTPLRSDTLAGHLLWAAAELDGDQAVTELIAGFEAGRPPFVVSSAFPGGMLPMPVAPAPGRQEFKERYVGPKTSLKEPFKNLFEALSAFKKFRKLPWLPVSVWKKLRGGYSLAGVFDAWRENAALFTLAGRDHGGDPTPWSKQTFEPHNSIDRTTGAVRDEGGLYFSPATFHATGAHLDLYVRTDDAPGFERLLNHVADSGFGRDRSTGKGHFAWRREDGVDLAWLEADGSHRLNLTVCSAAELRLEGGFYSPFAKHGRAWSATGEAHAFKKPFLALSEGAALTAADFTRLAAGSGLLRGVHADARIVQVVAPFGAPFTFSPAEARS